MDEDGPTVQHPVAVRDLDHDGVDPGAARNGYRGGAVAEPGGLRAGEAIQRMRRVGGRAANPDLSGHRGGEDDGQFDAGIGWPDAQGVAEVFEVHVTVRPGRGVAATGMQPGGGGHRQPRRASERAHGLAGQFDRGDGLRGEGRAPLAQVFPSPLPGRRPGQRRLEGGRFRQEVRWRRQDGPLVYVPAQFPHFLKERSAVTKGGLHPFEFGPGEGTFGVGEQFIRGYPGRGDRISLHGGTSGSDLR